MSVVLAPADEPSQSVLRLGERDEEFLRETNSLVGSCVRAAILTPEASEAYVRGLSNEVQTAVKSVSELREKNQQCFQEMSVELKLTIGDVYMKLQQVLGGIFQDNVINWGRIATVLAYGSHLAKFCTQNKLREVVGSVTPWITIFISTRLKVWIIDNGGWVRCLNNCSIVLANCNCPCFVLYFRLRITSSVCDSATATHLIQHSTTALVAG